MVPKWDNRETGVTPVRTRRCVRGRNPRILLSVIGTQLKNVFWPKLFVGTSFKILNIQQYASGFKLGSASILKQNPIFEMGSSKFVSDNEIKPLGPIIRR